MHKDAHLLLKKQDEAGTWNPPFRTQAEQQLQKTNQHDWISYLQEQLQRKKGQLVLCGSWKSPAKTNQGRHYLGYQLSTVYT